MAKGKRTLPDQVQFAKRYGKLDTERLGIFIEMPYFEEKARKKSYGFTGLRNMLPGVGKVKCGTQDGYFESEYKRIFAGDKGNRKDPYASKLQSRGTFIPPGYPKKHACPGDYFGSFSGIIPSVSRVLRKPKPEKAPRPNALTNPGKKGGPGYANICLNKYPEYKPPKFRIPKYRGPSGKPPMVPYTYPRPFFEPNIFVEFKEPTTRIYRKPKEKQFDIKTWVPTGPTKWLGGCKAGCFDKWPEWKDAKSFKKKKLYEPKFSMKSAKFLPQSYAEKTMSTRATLRNTEFCVNERNWKYATPKFVKYLIENPQIKK